MTSPLGLAVGIGMVLASGWAVMQARWAVEDRRTFIPAAGFLFAFGVSSTILSTPAAQVALPRLVANLTAGVATFCLAAWFLCALYDRPLRRVALQLLVLIIALSVAVTAWISDPGQVQRGLGGGGGPHGSAAVTFSLAIEVYLTLTLAQVGWLSGLYARRAAGRASRWGFAVLAAGLMVQVLMTGLKTVTVIGAAIVGDWSPALLRIYLGVRTLRPPSDTLMLAGAGYSAAVSLVVALPVWRAHRRDHLRMQPLRRLVYQAFPEHALDPVPPVWRDWLLPMRVHWRFYRCLIEILDGLDQLRPFYDRTVAQRAKEAPRATGLTDIDPGFENHLRAAVLCAAVRTHIEVEGLAAAAAAGLRSETHELCVFNALVAEGSRRDTAGVVYHDLDRIGHGTMGQVTRRLVALSAAVTRVNRCGLDLTASTSATPSAGQH